MKLSAIVSWPRKPAMGVIDDGMSKDRRPRWRCPQAKDMYARKYQRPVRRSHDFATACTANRRLCCTGRMSAQLGPGHRCTHRARLKEIVRPLVCLRCGLCSPTRVSNPGGIADASCSHETEFVVWKRAGDLKTQVEITALPNTSEDNSDEKCHLRPWVDVHANHAGLLGRFQCNT